MVEKKKVSNKNKKTKKQNNLSKFIKKLDIRKKIVPVLLSGIVLSGVGLGAYKLGKSNGEKESSISYTDENLEGFDSIGTIFNGNVKKNNFVVLDIGDHDSVETLFQNKKMKLCNDKDISLGVVISSDAENECDIYNDVDYVKGIVRDYKIDFPIYLNIDNIITNESLNNNMKSTLINDFLTKCSDNGMYVGISGTDTNLCDLKKFFDVSLYDAFVIMDKDSVSYDGVYNLYMTLDGKVHSKCDLSKSIVSGNLNSKNKFLLDGEFVVNGTNDLDYISLKYGISCTDLLKYNNIKEKDLKDGIIIKVPNVCNSINRKKSTADRNYTVSDEYLIGCDISYCQADNNNWDTLNKNFDFVILRSNQGTSADTCFEKNAQACSSYEIPMGVYTYNDYWKSDGNLEEFKKLQQQQANYTVSLLKNKNLDYPVYLDIEKVGFSAANDLPADYAEAMLDIWYNTITKAGFIPGVYFNQSVAGAIENEISYKLSDKFEVWLAGGPQYESKDSNGQYIEYSIDDMVVPQFFSDGKFGANMCQPGLVYGAGSGNGLGFLDFDYCKVDYAGSGEHKVVDEDVKFDDEIKSFKRIHKAVPITCVSLTGLGIAGFGLKTYHKKKEEEKRKAKKKVKNKK